MVCIWLTRKHKISICTKSRVPHAAAKCWLILFPKEQTTIIVFAHEVKMMEIFVNFFSQFLRLQSGLNLRCLEWNLHELFNQFIWRMFSIQFWYTFSYSGIPLQVLETLLIELNTVRKNAVSKYFNSKDYVKLICTLLFFLILVRIWNVFFNIKVQFYNYFCL